MTAAIAIHDPTLRDGNHAVSHSLSLEDIAAYCRAVDGCGLSVVEVGHGNGLGASSLQLGLARHADTEMLETARANLSRTRLGIHMIPGFARLDDIDTALRIGVEVLRIASHCTEASVTESYIEHARGNGAYVHGVLMMCHMASPERLLEEAMKQQGYGANAIVLMDSAGHLDPDSTRERIALLSSELSIPLGFHGHNNLGLAIANSLAAVQAGATIVDGCMRGFGAGAGNTQLETLCAVLERYRFATGVDIFALCRAIEQLESIAPVSTPTVVKTANLISGLYGVCSGFEKHVARAASEFGVEPRRIYEALAECNAVAGQEDLIISVASRLSQPSVA
ncbi:4-hydroxy-2-oxovalerate aldolase [Mitsuaria sp. RG]|uniref:4-hydroxy-2-oxovalerate aldolase n=1 Tax=Pseudomonas sp. RtIB026 TaxID=2749999 RepID=UPI001942D5D5|nr:4-hydroxy-2-oxovalerate aldolase [Pseudomonas sp. RtIB026]MDC0689036.1 4-hydroxy-2-oxovalerate aldolase [Mitsuaria sp. RG]BCJ06394.1 4-hydroxy-2-oxovalerate aldolase [Pseudomonas sp. RtIB026]